MDPEVFICHSSADARYAAKICARLEASGVKCWIAPRDPVPGIPYGQQLVNAIAAARIVLLVFSARANESPAVLSELELAANRRKIILPVRIEDVQPSSNLEFYVRAIHWFDAATRPLEEALSELIRDVQALVMGEEPHGVTTPTHEPSAAPKASNLPLQLTSFVGRDHDVAEIKALLESNRLASVIGSGGAGKTRAAIQIGAELFQNFSDGVWLVELAPISDRSLVPAAIAKVLDVRESADRPLLDTLLASLKSRHLMLILDNCEHVIDEVRGVASAILRNCQNVRILTTSRESLNIAGERVFRLPSLAVPPPREATKAKAALRYGAVALFNDRAHAVDARFTLTDANAMFVTEVCRRLDGIPLAIELAAARIKVLSPQQLAQRLDERFRVLTDGDRSALPRHQTMRALIDWSYDLLSAQERELFRKLSIFADGFTIEGASAVCGDETCDEIAVLDLVSSLVDKSLVQTDPGSENRYRLLESTRQYGREKLAENGEFQLSSKRHLAYVSELFKKAGEEYEATMLGAAVTNLAVELEDARTALDWGVQYAVTDAVDLFLAMRLWSHLGLHREAIDRAKHLLALLNDCDSPRCAGLWEKIARSAGGIGNFSIAMTAAEEAMRHARASNDSAVLADCLLRYADVMAHARRFDEALAALDEAEALALSSPRSKLQALHYRGLIGSIRGDLDTAASCFAQLRDLYASVGNDLGTVSAALNLAEREYARGSTSEAIESATSALSRAERLPDRGMWAQLTLNLAGYLGAAENTADARRAAMRAMAYYASSNPEGAYTAIALEHFALCLAIDGDFRNAAQLEGYVQKRFTQLSFEREYTECASHRRLLELLTENVGDDELAALLARGERMQAHEALAGAEYTGSLTR